MPSNRQKKPRLLTAEEIEGFDGAGGTQMRVEDVEAAPAEALQQIGHALDTMRGGKQNPQRASLDDFELAMYKHVWKPTSGEGAPQMLAARAKRTGRGVAGIAVHDPSANSPHFATVARLVDIDKF